MSVCLVLVLGLVATALAEDWWQHALIYQIYPLSFMDSDNDGSGDLKGITSKVDHFTDLGVNAVWLSSIYESPFKDNGYDVSDFLKLNSRFGSFDQLRELIKTLHDKNIKIILDFIPNHSSDMHPWFQDSVERRNGKDDYYVWRNPNSHIGETPQPPNNWKSVSGGSAWKYNEKRKQFYLHQFAEYQPDLNYDNEEVVKEMQNVLAFWLNTGADGFRVNAASYLMESNYDENEPLSDACTDVDSYYCYDHIYTKNQNSTYSLMKKFEEALLNGSEEAAKVLFVEADGNVEDTMSYFSRQSVPFNFNFFQLNREDNSSVYVNAVKNWMKDLPNDYPWGNWLTGNHDYSRVATKLGEDMVDVMNMLVLLLPGTGITYYGEELGMTDAYVPGYAKNDTRGRDPERTPYQWSNSTNAGFSNASKTWLPINQNYYQVNKATEMTVEESHLRNYMKLSKLRKDMKDVEFVDAEELGEYAFAIHLTNHIIIVNLDNKIQEVNLTNLGIDQTASTQYISGPNSTINDFDLTKPVKMQPRSAIMASLPSASVAAYAQMVLVLVCLFISVPR